MPEQEPAGHATRAQHFVRQARLLPRRVDITERNVLNVLDRLATIEAALEEHRAATQDARAAIRAIAESVDALVGARPEEVEAQAAMAHALASLAAAVEAVGRSGAELAAGAADPGQLVRVVDAPARDLELRRVIAELGAPPPLAHGLSVHLAGTRLEATDDAVERAAALLDALGEDGEVLVLDDDQSGPAPAATGADPRVRVIAAGRPLGAARARSALAAAARFRHALVLDPGVHVDAAAVRSMLRAARESGAAAVLAPLVERDDEGRGVRVLGADATQPGALSLRDVERVRALDARRVDGLADALEHHELALHLGLRGHAIAQLPVLAGSAAGQAVRGASPSTAVRDQLDAAYGGMRARRVRIGAPAVGVARPDGPRIVLASGSGVSNVGDDMILLALLARIRAAAGPDARLVVVSDGDRPPEVGREATWACTLGELARIEQGDLPDVLGLDDVDVCVLGGGGTIAQAFSREVRPRAALARAMAARGIPLVVTGQGLGPLAAAEEADLAAIAGVARSFSVRDARSASLLADLGRRDAPVLIDDAVGLEPASAARVDAALAAAGLEPGSPFVVATLRAAPYAADEAATARWAAAIDRWAAARGLPVALLPMSRWPAPDEAGLGAQLMGRGELVARWTLVDAGLDARLIAGVLARAAAVAAASYHAGLLASCAGVPAAFLAAGGYQGGKCAGTAALLGLPIAVVLDEGAGSDALATALACAPPEPAHLAGLVRARDAALVAALRSTLPALPGADFGENGRPEA